MESAPPGRIGGPGLQRRLTAEDIAYAGEKGYEDIRAEGGLAGHRRKRRISVRQRVYWVSTRGMPERSCAQGCAERHQYWLLGTSRSRCLIEPTRSPKNAESPSSGAE